MNIQITCRKIHLNDARKEFIEETLLGLSKYNLDLQSIHVVLKQDHNMIDIEVIINISGHSAFVFHQEDKDIYGGIYSVYQSIEKTLRRYHDKNISKKRKYQKITEVMYLDSVADTVIEEDYDDLEETL